MKRNLSSSQLEVLALRALVFIEQVREKKSYGHVCLQSAAFVLAHTASTTTPTLDVPATQRAIVSMGERLERLLRGTPPEALRNVAHGFEQLPDRGRLRKPLVPTPAFQALLRAVREAGRAARKQKNPGKIPVGSPQSTLL